MRHIHNHMHTPADVFHMLRGFSLAFILMLVSATTAHAEECMLRDSNWSWENREPYTGYQATGYKGSMERDNAWFRSVKPVKKDNGKIQYRFKWQTKHDKTLFDSIETVPLGGNAIGFAAYQKSCGKLFSSRGKKYELPLFAMLEYDYLVENTQTGKVKLKLVGLVSSDSRYALFVKGKLNAISAHEYVNPDQNSPLFSHLNFPDEYQDITIRSQTGGRGIIRRDTLDEVIEPRWRGVGGLTIHEGIKARYVYFITQDEQQVTNIYSSDGQLLKVERFDTIKIIRSWFPKETSPSEIERTVIATVDKANATCRIYTVHMSPAIDEDLQLDKVSGECPLNAGKLFQVTNKLGKTSVYANMPGPRLVKRAEIADALAYKFRGGVMLFQKESPNGRTYWVAKPDGTRLNDTDFAGFMPLGCDFVRVKHDGAWVMLLPDGSVDKHLSYPFSC